MSKILVNNNRGGAYILTVIVMLIVFSLSASILYISDNEALAALGYSENIGGYEAAVSGIIYARDLLQKTVDENRRSIDEKAVNEILNAPLDSISFYRDDPMDKYGGQFHLKTPGGGSPPGEDRLYYNLFAKYAGEALRDIIEDGCRLSISYTKEKAGVKYLVTVIIKESFAGQYILESAAQNENTGVCDKASATVAFCAPEAETFTEKYPLDTNIPPYLSGGVYALGELKSNSSSFSAASSFFNQDERAPEESFYGFLSKSVIVENDGYFDVSLHCGEGGVFPAAVVYQGSGSLVITASDPVHNYFEGIIVSYGGIKAKDANVRIKGQIYCAGDLVLENSVFSVEYKNTLPEILFDSQSEKREFLDKLGVIDFEAAASSVSGFEIDTLKPGRTGRLEIINLKKAD